MATTQPIDFGETPSPLSAGLSASGRRRLACLGLIGLGCFGVWVGRLHLLQVEQGAFYQRQARINCVVVEHHAAARGRIFDSSGRLLVSNSPQMQLEILPVEVKSTQQLAHQLASLLNLSPEKILKKLKHGLKVAPLERVPIARSLSAQEMAQLTVLARTQPGVYLEVRDQRKFHEQILRTDSPHEAIRAAHVLGYTGEISENELERMRSSGYRPLDRIGKEGVERTYDLEFRGHKGLRELLVDARGRLVNQKEIRSPIPGLDAHLCLDWQLQNECEKALAEQLKMVQDRNGEISGGSVVVMEVKTGRLKALVSLPHYDPRPFSRGIKEREYASLLANPGLPLVDRATRSEYSPGSTFKLVTSSAAMHEHLCGPVSSFYCGGSYAGANCFVRSGHGGINFESSIAVSCDVVYYMLGVKLGIDRLRHYCSAMGLGKRTGLDLPGEATGHLPSPKWKLKFVGEKWFEGDTVNMSIGQGFLLTTPLQMAVVTASVANGGQIVRPHVMDYFTNSKGTIVKKISSRPVRKLPFHAENLAALRRGMRGAVTYGTGGACNSSFVQVAGKTGTVENSPSSENRFARDHTWFVSFAPFEAPKYVVVVQLEKSGGFGGSMCAPVARKVYDYLYGPQGQELRKIQPTLTKRSKPKAAVVVANPRLDKLKIGYIL
jgi:penicillin-binding protein 2